MLKLSGFHLAHPQGKQRPIAYQQGVELVLYSRGKENETLCQPYLVCLYLELHNGRRPVDHFRPTQYYNSWLAGEDR